MKVAFIVPCRDKSLALRTTIASVLNQTYYPMEIILSDQGSCDGTLEIITKMAKEYKGNNTVRVVKCPDTALRGMAGLDRHLNWLNKQTDADIVILSSADDYNHPRRAEKVVRAFELFNPDMVLTAMEFTDLKEGYPRFNGQTAHGETGFLTGEELLRDRIGGSSSPAWRREFFEKIGGFEDVEIQDVYMPYLASQGQGCYFIKEVLYAYLQWSSDKNTGLGGAMMAAEESKDEDEKLRLQELSHYQILNTLLKAIQKAERIYPNGKQKDREEAYRQIMAQSYSWCHARNILTMKKIQPKGLPA